MCDTRGGDRGVDATQESRLLLRSSRRNNKLQSLLVCSQMSSSSSTTDAEKEESLLRNCSHLRACESTSSAGRDFACDPRSERRERTADVSEQTVSRQTVSGSKDVMTEGIDAKKRQRLAFAVTTTAVTTDHHHHRDSCFSSDSESEPASVS